MRGRPLLPALMVVVIGTTGCGPGSSASNTAPPAPQVASPGASSSATDESSAWVAYQSSLAGKKSGLDGLFLVHPDGSDDHEIATSLAGQHIHPDWSSTGRSIAFRADVADHPQLFLINPLADPAGRQALQLTQC